MFQHVLLSEEACAESFFNYLTQHPELSKFHAHYVQTLRICALNHYSGEIAYAITHALFFAAEDWIASNIKKIDKLADIKVSNYSTYDPIFNDFMKQIPSKSSKVTFNEMQSYLEDKFNLKVKLSSISLLDVDKDGYISQRSPSDEEVLKLAQKYFDFIYVG